MGILQINTSSSGQVGINPRRVTLITTDNIATITTAAYLNNATLQGYTIYPTDILDVWYDYVDNNDTGILGVFTPDIVNGVITLNDWTNPGDVLLPVVNGNFSVFNGTSGQMKDDGYSPSDADKTKVVMAGSATTVGYIAHFTDTSGTIDDTAGTVINVGTIQAGISGALGNFDAMPPTESKGRLRLKAADSAGNTITTITNASMNQAVVFTVPDPGAATANILVAPSAFVSGNLIKASGTAGLAVDTGYKTISGLTPTATPSGTNWTYTALGLTTSSIVTATMKTQGAPGTAAIAYVVPGTNVLDVFFTADPGTGTSVYYIATSASAS